MAKLNDDATHDQQRAAVYAGGSNPDGTTAVLKTYTTALLSQRATREEVAIQAVVNQLQQVTPQTARLVTNEKTLAKSLQQVPATSPAASVRVGRLRRSESRPGGPPTILAVLGGFLAGVAFFALVALIMGRLDNRVRRPEDIEVGGRPGRGHPLSGRSGLRPAAALRAGAVRHGYALAVIAVTRATRGEGASGLALALARHVRRVGTPTILVSADLRGRTAREQEGLSALLDGTATSMPLIALEENLMWLPEGTSNAAPETLFRAAGRAHRARSA